MKRNLSVIVLTLAITRTVFCADKSLKITLRIENRVVTATLLDNKTARDFISLLPLSLTMDDLFDREKYGPLPRALSKGVATRSYEIGDIALWSPGPDVAIYYRNDGQRIPDPGITLIGKIESGIEAFDLPGSVKVTIEPAGNL